MKKINIDKKTLIYYSQEKKNKEMMLIFLFGNSKKRIER